ncbi:MAG: 50S ribosomal protein L4 [Clostridia bacterium]|nr:50S ribosomal protein L4 [Clostridia bacterium]
MPKIDLYKMDGSVAGKIELSEAVFGQKVNASVLHTVVVNHLANKRQGTQSAKTRSEVSGGGAKPFRQKGTGRARQGSIRAAQWIKGGVVFAPKPRDYRFSVNKKVKKVAMRSALSDKVAENSMIVIDDLKFEEIKTKQVNELLKNLGVDTKALIVTCDKDENIYLSARNIYGVDASFVGMLNVYDILNHAKLIVARDAVEKIEEVYA